MADNDATIKKNCGYCAGKGQVAEDGFDGDIIICPVCGGKAEVNVEADTVPHVICDGRGKIRMRGPMGKENVLCPACSGTGWYHPPGF